MIGKLKALCMRSATIAWSYILAIFGMIMQGLDGIVDALGDPGLKDQISAAVGDAKTVGRILLGISIINILVRLRSLRKQV